mgnify:CR=1 FL=1
MPSFSLWKSCVHPDDLPQLMQQIDLALRETNILDSEFRVIYPDDSIHYLRTHAMVERDAEGNASRMVGTNWDITELRALMNDLSHERELLRTTLLSIGEAVIMTDQKARIVFMNPAAERMLICTNNNVLYCSIDEVMKVVDADGNPLPNPLYAALEQRRLVYLDHDAYLQIIDGTTIAIQDSAAPILRNNNELLGGVLVFSDVTEMRSLQKRLGYQASHDPLTGLINRSAFETILQDVVKESVMTAGHSVLVFLDLDHFKQVNDTAGHAAGDELLKQLASLMNARMRASDIVARLGGDEFGVIMPATEPGEAKVLLAAAGYPGGRDAVSGKPLVLNYDFQRAVTPEFKSENDWMVKQFAKLGIQLEIRATDFNQYQDKTLKGKHQIYWAGWLADYPDAENFTFLLYGPNAKSKNNGENISNYANAEFDALHRQVQMLDDGPAKQAALDRMVAILQHDAPWAFGYFPWGGLAFQQWVHNGKPSILIRDMAKYYRVDPALRAARQAEWNAPVRWPLALVAIGVLALLWAARRSVRQRETATARRRAPA